MPGELKKYDVILNFGRGSLFISRELITKSISNTPQYKIAMNAFENSKT